VVPWGTSPLSFLAPGVLGDLAAEVFDRIDQELGEIEWVVDVAAGLFLAEVEIIAGPERRGVKLVAVVTVIFLGVKGAVAVQVVKEVRVGGLIVDDRVTDVVP
jgi:hypothetical protein